MTVKEMRAFLKAFKNGVVVEVRDKAGNFVESACYYHVEGERVIQLVGEDDDGEEE